MRYFCISGDPDVLTGMRLAGIEGVLARERSEVERAVSAACADSEIAILLVTEGCYELCRDRLNELKLSVGRPLINVIADSHGTKREPNSITKLIDEAIGVKIDAKF